MYVQSFIWRLANNQLSCQNQFLIHLILFNQLQQWWAIRLLFIWTPSWTDKFYVLLPACVAVA